MKVKLTEGAIKQYRQLSSPLKRKTDKQLGYLLTDPRHPSLKAKNIKVLLTYGKVELTRTTASIFI